MAALLPGLAGCAQLAQWWDNGFEVGPDYMQPEAEVAESWIDFNDRRVISDAETDRNWWLVFDEPALDTLIATCYEQNLTLRQAGLRVLEARARRAIAAGNQFPQSQTASGFFRRVNLADGSSQAGLLPDFTNFDFWSLGTGLNWELDVWGKFRRAVESADAELNASIEDYDDMLVCLLAETAQTYIELRTFEERIALARQNVKAQEEAVRLAAARFREGATSELDVTQARALLGQTQAMIPQLEAGQRDANNRLCILLGTPPRDLYTELGEGTIPVAPTEVAVGIPAELLRRRPDIRRAEREVAAQSAQIGIAAADLFPAFSLAGSMNWSGDKFSHMFNSAFFGGSAGPSMDWKILNYGRIINNVRAQDARFQQLAVNYQNTVLNANAEVENALIGFLKAQERAAHYRTTVEQSQRSLQLVTRQYQEGDTDLDRVVNVLKDLVQQQDQLAIARADIALDLIRIYKGLGGGWQIRLDGGPIALPFAEGAEELDTPELTPPADDESSQEIQFEPPLPDVF